MYLLKFVSFLAVACFSLASLAQEKQLKQETKISEAVRKCIFEKPIEAGASVTGQVGQTIPFYGAITSYFFNAKSGPYKSSPSQLFINHYRSMGVTFAGPKYKVGDGISEIIASPITSNYSDIGSGQIESLLTGSRTDLFKRSSILIGLDLFYWDSIWNQCGYGKARYFKQLSGRHDTSSRRGDIEFQIVRLIQSASSAGKILMLGTVPLEDAEKVEIYDSKNPDDGFWFPQNKDCVRSINQTLAKHCTLENRCYLMDFSDLVDRLNAGEKFSLKKDSQQYGLYDMRPDGIHLSSVGSQFLAERMVDLFEAHPPACGSER